MSAITTSFFPHPLRCLVVIAAGSCETGPVRSPHDVRDWNSVAQPPSWSGRSRDHFPVPLSDATAEYVLRRSVSDIIQQDTDQTQSPADATDVGVLVVASATNHRFYDAWCSRWPQAVCISTGHSTCDEPAARSVQRALRVLSGRPPQYLEQLQRVVVIDADALGRRIEFANFDSPAQPASFVVGVFKDFAGGRQTGEGSVLVSASQGDGRHGELGMCFHGAATCGALVAAAALHDGGRCWQGSAEILEIAKRIQGEREHEGLEHKAATMPVRTLHREIPPQRVVAPPASVPGGSGPTFVVGRSYARVGLLGNPSDQLHGKSLAVSVSNWWATVTITRLEADPNGTSASAAPDGTIDIVPHPIADASCSTGGIDALHRQICNNGYVGGVRLLQATLKRFLELLLAQARNTDADVAAVAGRTLRKLRATPMRMHYDTNVPRQVGLAGSSCIVSAALKALLQFYELAPIVSGSGSGNGAAAKSDDEAAADAAAALAATQAGELLLPQAKRPTFVLDVESQELGINAGLMDRVAQIYEGLMLMDFTDNARTQREGHAVYTRLEPIDALLPELYLAIALDPSDSGKIHATVRARFARGDEEVLAAVRQWVSFVDDGVAALQRGDKDTLRDLMDANCNLRRKIYGDECLGWKNLRMVEIARKHGAAAKFPGSGGAILVAPRPGATDVAALQAEMEAAGFSLVRLQPTGPKASE